MFKIIRHGFSLSENVTQCGLHHKNTTKLYQEAVSTQARFDHSAFNNPGVDKRHIICRRSWNRDMIKGMLQSALKFKKLFGNTHGKILNLLPCTKVMILDDHNEPILRMAVTKAISMLGASDVHIRDQIDWDHDYQGRVFSELADVIFVSSETEGCVKRFSSHCSVPVVCMRSRKHASVQSLATLMSIMMTYQEYSSENTIPEAFSIVEPSQMIITDDIL